MNRTLTAIAFLASLTPSVTIAMGVTPRPTTKATALAPKTGDLKILVVEPGGKPMAGARVEITRSAGSCLPMMRTADKSGMIREKGLAEGEYLIVAFNEDNSDFDWCIIRVKAGDGVSLTLSPPAPRH
ncbi:MAG: hypothetical protein JNK25_09645 [Phycisphaerae bacterium]|nr:hypothetical protein [Phycisphaerae bacterium]